MASIPVLSAGASHSDVAQTLLRVGCVVVRGTISPDFRDALRNELGTYVEAADPERSLNEKYAEQGGPSDFYPGHTRRITALVAKSEHFRMLVTHPLMLSVCDTILKPNCSLYQVHATAGLVVGPGATVQVLHREEDPFRFFSLPRPHM